MSASSASSPLNSSDEKWLGFRSRPMFWIWMLISVGFVIVVVAAVLFVCLLVKTGPFLGD
jgi:hypothetical protein